MLRVAPVGAFLVGLILVATVAGKPERITEVALPRGYVCPRTHSAIQIDGKLDDEAWAAAPWSDKFVDIRGGTRPLPKYATRMKMTWDEKALYIAAELEEPHVRAVMTRHDSYIFHEDNDFEVFIDGNGDSQLYAELELNARNTTWDLLLTRPYSAGGCAIDDWEIRGLKTAVHVDGTLNDPSDRDRGWTVEIAWPWEGLKQLGLNHAPPRPGDQWRINFSRVEWDIDIVNGKYRRIPNRPEQNWVWSPQGAVDMHRPQQWGYLQFADSTPLPPFKVDETAAARLILDRIYHAQTGRIKSRGAYAATLAELGLDGLGHSTIVGSPTIELAHDRYRATATLKDGRRVQVYSDALVTVEEPRPR